MRPIGRLVIWISLSVILMDTCYAAVNTELFVVTKSMIHNTTSHQIIQSVRSRIECAVECKKNQNCSAFSYDNKAKLCKMSKCILGQVCYAPSGHSIQTDITIFGTTAQKETTTVFLNVCPTGYTAYSDGSLKICLKYISTAMNHDDAWLTCIAEGGKLMLLRSNQMRLLLNDVISGLGGVGHIWLEGNDKANEGTWLTRDGNPLPYTDWGGSCPNGGRSANCAYAKNLDGRMIRDRDCTLLFVFFCEAALI